ncbi:hypothetical protein CDD81_589 [Ophiocordyceps australis]|uniref:Metallo-beta-lactamase domain-containing protein n=1 Tax=Ophiocordyceps australis TaxID=1399860 RepID=A0A2C5YGF7_9HYPO|nr:hypothetical protein CDD81_589 [Ophiocordyceps australis]
MASSTKPKGFYASNFWTDYLSTQRSKLPVLADVDDGVSDLVVRFLGGNPGNMQLQGTSTYLVGTGSSRILIDTGEGHPQWAVNVVRYLEDHDVSISHILLTHWHRDHTGGVADLLAHDADIAVHKHEPEADQHDITDGQVFSTEGATIKAVWTPGHTTDHMCFLLEEEDALFTGDNVLGHGFSIAEDLESYTQSLRLMQSLQCRIGYPGHGDVIRDFARTITRYIAQRESREQQVYAALLQQASSRTCRGSSYASDSSSCSDYSSADEDEDDMEQGLSITGIGSRLYGELSIDTATFDSALKPLISQVLVMLAEHGKVSSKLVGMDKQRYWFARLQAIN